MKVAFFSNSYLPYLSGITLSIKTLKDELRALGHQVRDLGTESADPCDYPDYAAAVARAVAAGTADLGVLACKTGIGMSIAANKVPGIRAAACHSALEARLSRGHNDSNVLCVGGGTLGADEILAFSPWQAHQVSIAFLAVVSLQWLVQMNADGTGYLAQRSMACRSDRDARTAAVVFTVAQILLRSLLWLPIAVGLLVLFPPDPSLAPGLVVAEREATFVTGIHRLLPVGLLGLMLTAMLAALASTVDTHLNWGASYLTNDLYKRFYCSWRGRTPTDRTLVWVARGSNALILLTSLLIMTQLSSIQMAWQASLLLGAGLGVLLVLRWLWWRITAWGEVAALASSTVLAPILIAVFPAKHEALRLLIMAVVATTAGIATSLSHLC